MSATHPPLTVLGTQTGRLHAVVPRSREPVTMLGDEEYMEACLCHRPLTALEHDDATSGHTEAGDRDPD